MKKILLTEVIKIKNILTAIGNPILNNKLKELNYLNIINKDIQYQDGVLEILEINKEIDFLIIGQSLPGELKLEELIENIQDQNPKIKIIIILEKYNKELENILFKKGIYRILYNNEIKIENILNIINSDEKMEKYNQEIQKEINELKNEIIKNKYEKEKIKNELKTNSENKTNNKINNKLNIKKNNINRNKNKTKNIFNNILKKLEEKSRKNNLYKNKQLSNKFIFSILGNNGSGKSIFSVLLSHELTKYYNKILIIDFDILNKSIHTILGIKKYPENFKINDINLNNLIVKINKKIDLISEINLIFNNKNKLNFEKLKEMMDELLKKYDVIIIDTTSECFFEYTKEIINVSNKCIFLTETNLLEISKSKRILSEYMKWNIDKNKNYF